MTNRNFILQSHKKTSGRAVVRKKIHIQCGSAKCFGAAECFILELTEGYACGFRDQTNLAAIYGLFRHACPYFHAALRFTYDFHGTSA
jgi:hypothetical protein